MIIERPKVTMGGERVTVSAGVDGRKLWFSVPSAYGDYVTDQADPFLVASLLLAMKNGEPLQIGGSVSAKLVYNLPRVMSLLSALISGLKPIEVRVDRTHEGRPCAGVVSGFSGGVDSFCTIADHITGPYRLTHLVYNKVGAHPSDQIFRQHFEHLLPAAKSLGLPLISIESNVDDFVPFAFQQSHTIRNVSALLVLQSMAGQYLYSSAYSYRNIAVKKTYDMAYVDPVLLPLLSTERMECISVGSEYTRVAKTLRVAEVPGSYKFLDVCVQPQNAKNGKPNCSTCWKCMRTELTLEIAGKLDLYRDVFDLEAWRQVRASYQREVRSSRGVPLLREVDDFARERGYNMPFMLASHIASAPRRLSESRYKLERKVMELAPRRLKDAVKKLARVSPPPSGSAKAASSSEAGH